MPRLRRQPAANGTAPHRYGRRRGACAGRAGRASSPARRDRERGCAGPVPVAVSNTPAPRRARQPGAENGKSADFRGSRCRSARRGSLRRMRPLVRIQSAHFAEPNPHRNPRCGFLVLCCWARSRYQERVPLQAVTSSCGLRDRSQFLQQEAFALASDAASGDRPPALRR